MANERNNEKDGKKMTVREFCLYKTQVNELCAIVDDSGYIIATVWIDIEICYIHRRIKTGNQRYLLLS